LIYTTNAVRSVSKQVHLRPHYHSEARSTFIWELVTLQVHNIPVEGEGCK